MKEENKVLKKSMEHVMKDFYDLQRKVSVLQQANKITKVNVTPNRYVVR